MRAVKSIDELYEEVKDYGLVITNDVALETALNARIDQPRIGVLAMTPRHIIQQLGPIILGERMMSDLQIIRAIHEETGYSFKQVYSEILNFRQIRAYTPDVWNYLTSKSSKDIYRSYRALPTLEKAMGEFDPDDPRVSWFFQRSEGVVTIGVDLFDQLDRSFNQACWDDIEIFKDGEYEIETIHEIGNDRQLAENAVDLIDENDPDSYAIVLNAAGSIADSVRAALYRRNLPFINSLSVSDLSQIRDYLSFITLAQSYHTLRVKSVKELFSNYNGFFKPKREEYLLDRQGPDDMRDHALELQDAMRRICDEGMTFAEVKDIVCNQQARPQVTMVLDELGMLDEIITPDRISEIRFAIENVSELKHNEQIPENENHGVLIVDCKNSMYIDRPVVIYLGMEQDWNIPIIGKRYIDTESESEKIATKLEAMIQQGQRRVYCVNSNKMGKAARPCLTFDTIVNNEGDRLHSTESFGDICKEYVVGRWYNPEKTVESARGSFTDRSDESFDMFSKSSFDAYMACPRKFMFNRLLPNAENSKSEFGNLIHEFAELYATHPDIVKEKGLDAFTTMISDRYVGLSSPLKNELDTDRIRMAMRNVMRYIDSLDMKPELDSTNASKNQPNRFLKELGEEMTSTVCEVDYSSSKHPMHGIFDLYWDGVITDYKTGKPLKINEIGKNMSLDSITGHPEFQPLMYLALSMEKSDSRMVFNQFYAMDNDVDSLDDDFDIRRNVRTIQVLQMDCFEYLLRTKDGLDWIEENLTSKLKGNAETIARTLDSYHCRDPSKWMNDDELYALILKNLGKNDNKSNREPVRSIIKKIVEVLTAKNITKGNVRIVPLADINDFLAVLDQKHAELNDRMNTCLPAQPAGKVDCKKCDFYAACMGCSAYVLEDDSDD